MQQHITGELLEKLNQQLNKIDPTDTLWLEKLNEKKKLKSKIYYFDIPLVLNSQKYNIRLTQYSCNIRQTQLIQITENGEPLRITSAFRTHRTQKALMLKTLREKFIPIADQKQVGSYWLNQIQQ